MSIQLAYVPVQNLRPPADRKAFSPREFATLGNFTARTPAGAAWSGQLGASRGTAYPVVPPVGINIPKTGQ